MKTARIGEELGAGPVGFEPTSSAPKAKRISELPHGPARVIGLAYNMLWRDESVPVRQQSNQNIRDDEHDH